MITQKSFNYNEKNTSITLLSPSEMEFVHGGDLPTKEELETAVKFAEEVGEVLEQEGFFSKLGNKTTIALYTVGVALCAGVAWLVIGHLTKAKAKLT